MITRRILRATALILILLATLSPLAAASRQSNLACDDFANPDAAQHLLDLDPAYEDALDSDADGIACNEDEPGTRPDRDEPANEDAEEYLATVRDEVDALIESSEDFEALFVDGEFDPATEASILEDVLAFWDTAPARADELDAPAEYAEIHEAYIATAAAYGAANDIYWDWVEAPASSDDEDRADLFMTAWADADAQAAALDDLLTAANA